MTGDIILYKHFGGVFARHYAKKESRKHVNYRIGSSALTEKTSLVGRFDSPFLFEKGAGK